MSRPVRAIALAALALSAPVLAQSQSRKLERDIAFVRALAEKLRFISLAQSEVERLLAEHEKSDDFKAIAQLGIEISLIGAKLHPSREKKRSLFKDALERSAEFIKRYEGDPVARAARITLASAAVEYGRYLADEIEIARTEEPDKVKALEEEAATVFRAGEDACEKVLAELRPLKDSAPQARLQYHLTWLRKGILLREHGRAVRKDREYLVDSARETLEDLILDVGEETALGLKGLLELAQCDDVMGNLEEAVRSYSDVIGAAYTALTSGEIDLSGELRELIVVLMEEAYDRKADALFELGRTQEVLDLVKEYRKKLEELGVQVTKVEDGKVIDGSEDPRFGHSLYITEARALAESGKPELVAKALEQAKYYNRKHPNDVIGLKAKAVIKEILQAQARLVSGTLLLEVAKGDYQAKNYELAIGGIKKALAAMSREEVQKNGLEAYYLMGHSFALLDRPLEAVMALQRGLRELGAASDKDIRARATDLLQRAMRRLRSNAKNDPFFDSLNDRVLDLAARFGTPESGAERYWRQGNELRANKKYAEAIEAYRKIAKGTPYYELAQARIVACLRGLERFDEALETIRAYRAFLQTKDARLPADRPDLQQIRNLALAETDFNDGYVLYLKAMGDGKTKNLTLFPKVVEKLSDFADRHGKVAPQLVPLVYYVLGRSYLEMGEIAKAEEVYRTLQKTSPRSSFVASLASAVFTALYDQLQSQIKVISGEAVSKDPAKRKAELHKLEAMRKHLLQFGLDYLETSNDPQYEIAFVTLEQAEALEDWPRVESLGSKIAKIFGSNPRYAPRVEKFVKAIVGHALLRQHKYRQAHDLLAAAEKADPRNYPLKRLVALALGGWQEIDELGRVKRYYGLDRPQEAYQKMWIEYRTYALSSQRGVTDFSLPWYRFHFETYHFARRAAEQDTEFRRRARTIYNIARSIDDFGKLREMGKTNKEAQDLYQLFIENPPPE